MTKRRLAAATAILTATGAGATLAVSADGASTASGTRSVIVVLKDQHADQPASGGHLAKRSAAVSSDQAPVTARVRRSGGTVTHSYRTLNAFSATVDGAEASKLASDPAVAQVIPDAVVRLPRSRVGTSATPKGSPGAPSTPAGTCPTGGGTFANTQALDAVDAVSPGATGSGVKVAFLADGVDTENAEFKRAGVSIFKRYKDFSGDGTAADTTGGEAFLDATSIAAQGVNTYDLHAQNPDLIANCKTKIKGVAPGVDLYGYKVFPESGFGTTSAIVAAADYAITTDHVDVVNLSLGSDPFPDRATLDALKLFNAQAVAAGVTVTISSGDEGPANTVGSPAGEPGVITMGASTTFRDFAQGSYAATTLASSLATNPLAQLSSAGFTQSGRVVDLLAPGDSTTVACTASATYGDCTDFAGNPSNFLQIIGGTSESAPLAAGAAALVIQRYRTTHAGASPSPELVKALLTGTATDLGLPSREQGAGLLDAAAAVRAAGTAGTAGVSASPTQATITDQPGATQTQTVDVTNRSSAAQTVTASTRRLGAPQPLDSDTVTLDPDNDDTFSEFGGLRDRAYQVVTLPAIPAGRDRLDVRIAWTDPDSSVQVALISPTGVYSAYSRSGAGTDYAAATARRPAAGAWKAIIFTSVDGGYAGDVDYSASTASFDAGSPVTPASLSLAPGETKSVSVAVTVPQDAGDADQDLVLHSGSEAKDTVVPIVTRTLVPTTGDGGTFSGALVAGNGLGETDSFDFDVPAGKPAVTVGVTLDTDAELVSGYLLDPDGNAVAVTSNLQAAQDGSGTTKGLFAAHLDPRAGRWRFLINEIAPSSGTDLSLGYTGAVGFAAPQVTAADLPNDAAARLRAGQTVTARAHVTNTTPSALPLVADARTGDPTGQPLVVQTDDRAAALADVAGPNAVPYLVPPGTSSLTAAATADNPIALELNSPTGDPDLAATNPGSAGTAIGTSLSFTYSADEVQNGDWGLTPQLAKVGGFDDDPAPDTTAQTSLTATTPAFDRTVESSTGDPWLKSVDADAPDANPVTLAPGRSADISVAITPTGSDGTARSGTLQIATFDLLTGSGQVLAKLPYRYVVGAPAAPGGPPSAPPGPPAAGPPPITPQAAVAAVIKAKLTRTGSLGIRDLLRFGAATELFTPPGAGTLHVSWKTRGRPRVTLATATKTYTAASATPVKVRVKLTRSGRKYLKHRTRLTFTEEVTFTPKGGKAVKSTVTRRLSRG